MTPVVLSYRSQDSLARHGSGTNSKETYIVIFLYTNEYSRPGNEIREITRNKKKSYSYLSCGTSQGPNTIHTSFITTYLFHY